MFRGIYVRVLIMATGYYLLVQDSGECSRMANLGLAESVPLW